MVFREGKLVWSKCDGKLLTKLQVSRWTNKGKSRHWVLHKVSAWGKWVLWHIQRHWEEVVKGPFFVIHGSSLTKQCGNVASGSGLVLTWPSMNIYQRYSFIFLYPILSAGRPVGTCFISWCSSLLPVIGCWCSCRSQLQSQSLLYPSIYERTIFQTYIDVPSLLLCMGRNQSSPSDYFFCYYFEAD